jgi:hypothetical protein
MTKRGYSSSPEKQTKITKRGYSSSPEKQTKQKLLKEDTVAHQRNKQNKNE